MGENTKIEWADDSVSFWWGCTHHGLGCLNFYAEKLSKRSGGFWGPKEPRLWIKSAPSETPEYQSRKIVQSAAMRGKERLLEGFPQ